MDVFTGKLNVTFGVFVAIALSGMSSATNHNCPSVCSCSHRQGRLEVICTGRNLSSVPSNISHETTRLTLSYNSLTVISESDLKHLVMLRFLDLSNNFINKIEEASFDRLENLTQLNIENNVIDICNDNSLPSNLFKNQQLLEILNLKRNRYCSVYPERVFQFLTGIKRLYLDSIPHLKLPSKFGLLRKLNLLDFSGNEDDAIGNTVHIKNNSFAVLRNISLKFLILKSAYIATIEIDAFSHLKNIEIIDLSYNTRIGTHGALMTTYGLRNTTIKTLLLNRTHSGGYFELKNFYTRFLNQTDIKCLVLDSNGIDKMEDGFYLNMAKIESLSIADNAFKTGQSIKELYFMKNLRFLNVSWRIRDITFTNEYSGSGVSFISTQIPNNFTTKTILPHTVENNSHTYELDVLYAPMPPELSHVFASHLKVNFDIPHIVLSHNKLQHIDLSNNGFCPWRGKIENVNRSNPLSILYFDLSNNTCGQVSDYFFDSFKYLEHLNIGGNRLRNVVKRQGNMFSQLNNLCFLDLSRNYLVYLPETFLLQQTRMKTLILRQNDIEEINFRISHMKRLRYLDLSNNDITVLQKATIDDLDLLQNMSLDLSNNKIACNCRSLYFIKWLRNTRITLHNFQSYSCMFDNGTRAYIQNLDIVQFEFDCLDSWWSYFTISASVCLLFLVSCVSVSIRYRHSIQLFILKFRLKRQGYLDCLPNGIHQYDAFVSYAIEDRSWIWDNLIPTIEGRMRMNLCIYERDFIPGRTIIDNIATCMFGSRKIVLVVSGHFVDSGWCQYESQLAQIRRIQERKDVVIVVRLSPFPLDMLSRDMVTLLNTVVYMEWPQSQHEQQMFYERLAEALRI